MFVRLALVSSQLSCKLSCFKLLHLLTSVSICLSVIVPINSKGIYITRALILDISGRTKQQNGTKCNKTNKTQQNTKIFVVAQQNNKIFCSFTTKQQNSKTTKQQNNKIFLIQLNKTTKYFVVSQRNILLVY